MSTLFIILMVISMIGVLAVMGTGMFSMAKGGEFNKKYGNKLMKARLYFQAATLLFLFLAMSTK